MSTEQIRKGEKATMVFHSVIGARREDVRKFTVSDVRPYAQYDKSVHVWWIEPRKRMWRGTLVHGQTTL